MTARDFKRPILCRLGIHNIDKTRYVILRKRNGRHKWHRNYAVCTRCGRLVYLMEWKKGAVE